MGRSGGVSKFEKVSFEFRYEQGYGVSVADVRG